jgi:ABC-type xylose transport system substrate-binding protein
MKQQLEQRLKELRDQFESGQKMMAELESKQANLRDTLLRISGAIQVLEDENLLGGTYVSGQNADIESLKSIASNKQTITLAKSPKTLGYALAELAVKIITGNDKINIQQNGETNNGFRNVPSVLFDPVIVDKTNINKFVENSGYLKKEVLDK